MHVLFLEIQTERDWAVASIGPAFLAGYLRQKGRRGVQHSASILHVGLDWTADQVVAAVCEHAPDLVGLSLTTRQWLRGRDVVAGLRAALDVPVVAGGLHPTFAAEEVLSSPGFDYVCLGEGEEALVDLLGALAAGRSAAGIDNIQVRGGPKPRLRAPFEPLDELPWMARDMLNEQHGVRYMTTQRGCPFPCTYCAARKYNDLYEGNGEYGRRRSHESVLAELESLAANEGLSYIIFLDDTFTINHKWVREYCKVHRERLGTPFSLHARVETVNERMLEELAAAGCKHITYGVESGSERVRREVMHRPVTNDRMEEVFRWTQAAGIMTTANYILAIPGETRADLEETLALHQRLQPHDFGYFVFYPYPGTPLFQTCKDQGLLPDNYLALPANHRQSILNLRDLTPADVAEFYDRFTAMREQSYLARYGAALDAAGREALHAHYEESAAHG